MEGGEQIIAEANADNKDSLSESNNSEALLQTIDHKDDSNLNRLSQLISNIISEEEVSIFHTNFFATFKSQGWEEARVYVKPNSIKGTDWEGSWEPNERAASLGANMVLIPCYIEGNNGNSARWVLLAKYDVERKKESHTTVDIFDENLDENLVEYFENLFEKLPFRFSKRWRLCKDFKVETHEEDSVPDNCEARVAGWMAVLSIGTVTRATKKYGRPMNAVPNGACAKEKELSNISKERRKWLDDCLTENVFFAPKEEEIKFMEKREKVNIVGNEINKATVEKIDISIHSFQRVPFKMFEQYQNVPHLFCGYFNDARDQIIKEKKENKNDVAAKRKQREDDEIVMGKKKCM